MLQTYSHFLTLRLRWYVTASSRQFLRHWQWLLMVGLIVPGLPVIGILMVSAQLIVMTVLRGHGALWHIASLAGTQVGALLWVWPQRQNLTGAGFAPYAATLPISVIVRQSVNLTLLAVANSPIMVLLGVVLAAHAVPMDDVGIYQTCVLVVQLGAIFLVQLATLERRPVVPVGVGLADLLLGIGLRTTDDTCAWLLLSLTVAVLLGVLLVPDRHRKRPGLTARLIHLEPASVILRRQRPLAIILRIQCKALAAHPVATTLRLGMPLLLAVGTDKLIGIFQFDGRSLPTTIVAMAVTALLLSGIYRALRNAHLPTETFLMTLPVSPHFWPLRDTLFVLMLGLVPLLFFLFPLLVHRLASLLALGSLGLAYCALIAVLRAALPLGGRLSVMFATILSAGWAGAAISAVVR